MRNILITGANGQLGNEMRRLGAESGNRYICTDVAELDITSEEAVRRMMAEEHADVIVNCAAYTNVDKAEEEEERADLLNHKAPAILAAAARDFGATLIHVSTDYVFDGTGHLPYTEQDPTGPTSAYGRTKLAGEAAIQQSGCNYLIFRTAWLYSEFGNNFLKTMLRLTGERERLTVVFDQIGTPTYAADLAGAIFRIVEEGAYTGCNGIYHYSDEGVCSWYDFATAIARHAGHAKCEILPCHSWEYPSKVRRPAYSVLDKSKVKEGFGLRIPHWHDAMERCMQRLK